MRPRRLARALGSRPSSRSTTAVRCRRPAEAPGRAPSRRGGRERRPRLLLSGRPGAQRELTRLRPRRGQGHSQHADGAVPKHWRRHRRPRCGAGAPTASANIHHAEVTDYGAVVSRAERGRRQRHPQPGGGSGTRGRRAHHRDQPQRGRRREHRPQHREREHLPRRDAGGLRPGLLLANPARRDRGGRGRAGHRGHSQPRHRQHGRPPPARVGRDQPQRGDRQRLLRDFAGRGRHRSVHA